MNIEELSDIIKARETVHSMDEGALKTAYEIIHADIIKNEIEIINLSKKNAIGHCKMNIIIDELQYREEREAQDEQK